MTEATVTGPVSGLTRGADGWLMPRAEPNGVCTACWKVLERFQWAGGLALDSYGVRVGLRANDAGLFGAALDRLPPGWTAAPEPDVDPLYSITAVAGRSRTSPAPYFYLYRGGCLLTRVRGRDELLAAFESDLHLLIAAQSRDFLFVHAGVVSHQGRAIVVPGRSFSGKTSLVAALVRAGAEYLSDEYAVFDGHGRVLPYAKPLSVRDGGALAGGRYTAEDLGGRSGAGPVPVGLVVSAPYREGARWRPAAMTAGQALLALLENTVQVREQPRLAMRTLPLAVAQARGFRGRRGEADRAAAWLLARAGGGADGNLDGAS